MAPMADGVTICNYLLCSRPLQIAKKALRRKTLTARSGMRAVKSQELRPLAIPKRLFGKLKGAPIGRTPTSKRRLMLISLIHM